VLARCIRRNSVYAVVVPLYEWILHTLPQTVRSTKDPETLSPYLFCRLYRLYRPYVTGVVLSDVLALKFLQVWFFLFHFWCHHSDYCSQPICLLTCHNVKASYSNGNQTIENLPSDSWSEGRTCFANKVLLTFYWTIICRVCAHLLTFSCCRTMCAFMVDNFFQCLFIVHVHGEYNYRETITLNMTTNSKLSSFLLEAVKL